MLGSRSSHTNYRDFSFLPNRVLHVFSQGDGYTLIELLVAMALLTFVLIGSYSLMVSPVQSLETNLKSVGETQALLRAYQQMSLDLSTVIQPGLFNNVIFTGSQYALSFAKYGSNESIDTVTYTIRPSLNEVGIFVLERQVAGMDMLEQDEKPFTLLNDKDLTFEFWDPERQVWISTWNSKHQLGLPSVVRVRLSSGTVSFPIYSGRVFVGGRHEL